MNSTNGLLQWTDLLDDSIPLNSIGNLELLPAIIIQCHTIKRQFTPPLKRTQKVVISGN